MSREIANARKDRPKTHTVTVDFQVDAESTAHAKQVVSNTYYMDMEITNVTEK